MPALRSARLNLVLLVFVLHCLFCFAPPVSLCIACLCSVRSFFLVRPVFVRFSPSFLSLAWLSARLAWSPLHRRAASEHRRRSTPADPPARKTQGTLRAGPGAARASVGGCYLPVPFGSAPGVGGPSAFSSGTSSSVCGASRPFRAAFCAFRRARLPRNASARRSLRFFGRAVLPTRAEMRFFDGPLLASSSAMSLGTSTMARGPDLGCLHKRVR